MGSDRDSAVRLGAGSDDAVATLEDELDEGVVDDLQANLDEVDAALVRIVAGSYGVCIDCGEAIPKKRLTALPASARCIECQRKQEHRRGDASAAARARGRAASAVPNSVS